MAEANTSTTQQSADAQHLDDLTSLQQAPATLDQTAPASGVAASVQTGNAPEPDNPSLFNTTNIPNTNVLGTLGATNPDVPSEEPVADGVGRRTYNPELTQQLTQTQQAPLAETPGLKAVRVPELSPAATTQPTVAQPIATVTTTTTSTQPAATSLMSEVTQTSQTETPAVNAPPVAVDDSYTVERGATITINPLTGDSDSDGGSLTILSINGVLLTPGLAQTILVTNGTVSISAAGIITFTPALGFSGIVSFPYEISDGQGGT
ncbi:MAG: Ig-like domain-containing protein, partial [Fluviibacter sp.]